MIYQSDGQGIEGFEIPFQKGESFSYWVDLYNGSSQTVTITHVGPTIPSLYTLPGTQWSLSGQISDPGAQVGLGLSPWHPVTLPPGGNLQTLITVHMTGCFHQDSYEVFGDTPVTYSVWGVTDQQMVPMDFSLTMKGNGEPCP